MTSLAAVPVMVLVSVLLMRIEQGAGAHGFYGRENIGFSAHGSRATAFTILNELAHRPNIIERQLAHKEWNTVRASYNRAEYLHERREMMQQWGDYIDALAAGANVIPLRAEEHVQ